MPAIERDDPVGTEAHRQCGHGGIHGAQWQVRILANETAHANPVVRVRGNYREFRKPFQKARFYVCAVVSTEKVGHFGHAQRRDDDVGTASCQSLDARCVIRVRNVDRGEQRTAVSDRQQCRSPSRDSVQRPDPARRGRRSPPDLATAACVPGACKDVVRGPGEPRPTNSRRGVAPHAAPFGRDPSAWRSLFEASE